MSITVRELLSNDTLHLSLKTASDSTNLSRNICWVHITEVIDSTEFCEPGEILLTIGLEIPRFKNYRLPDNDELSTNDIALYNAAGSDTASTHNTAKANTAAQGSLNEIEFSARYDQYISDLVDLGVLAIGFGVGMRHPTIPTLLLEAAARHHLPVIEIPLDTTFQDISRIVSQSMTNEDHQFLRNSYIIQSRFVTAAMSDDPLHAITLSLSQSIRGWAAAFTADGKLLDISHAAIRYAAQQALLKYQALHQTPQSGQQSRTSTFTYDDYLCCITELRDSYQHPLGLLLGAVPAHESDGMTLRTAVINAGAVLSIATGIDAKLARKIKILRSIVINEIITGRGNIPRAIIAQLWGGIPTSPVVVLCTEGIETDINTLYEMTCLDMEYEYSSEKQSQNGFDTYSNRTIPFLFATHDKEFWVISSQTEAHQVAARLQMHLKQIHPSDSSIGISNPTSIDTIVSACSEARLNLHAVKIRDDNTANRNQIHKITELDINSLVSPEIAQSFSNAFLRPLLDRNGYSISTRATLLNTISAFIHSSFNVAGTAKRLNVHRHTVEHRLLKVEQILGIDIHNTDDLMKLTFALTEYQRKQAASQDI